MNFKLLPLIALLISLWSCNENNQTKELSPSEPITKSAFIPLIDETGAEYHGVYHFGESEMESSLLIHSSFKDDFFAQLKSGEFNDNATAWVWNYENLKNVRVEGNKFFSDKSNGEFVLNESTGEIALKIVDSWNYKGEELGYKTTTVDNYYAGDYTEASLATLRIEDLKKWNLNELRYMRNEIFARYGFKFNTGGAIDTYFKVYDWFKPTYKNVDAFLTVLEKQNIATIKEAENLVVDELTPLKTEEMETALIGSWICNASKSFDLNEDGSFHAEEFNNTQDGTWWLNNKTLHIFTNNDTVKFTIGHMDQTQMIIEKIDFKKWHLFFCQTGGDYRVYSVLKKERQISRNLKHALIGYWYNSEGFELKADGTYIHHGPDCADGTWELKNKTVIIKENECGGFEIEIEYLSSDRLLLGESWPLFRKQPEDASISTPKSEYQ